MAPIMQRQDFHFDLPPHLIAQYPLPCRSDSRLLTYDGHSQQYGHHVFKDLVDFLEPCDLLVMNNSKVIPARLYGNKASGGRIEFLIERVLSADSFLAHIKASKSPKPGTMIHVGEWTIEVLAKENALYHCKLFGVLDDLLQAHGHIPLPPYISRSDESSDLERYQTIYALHQGSVAAPTAGLHFDETIFAKLKQKGIQVAYTTLHVGAGTFQPVRCDKLKEHKMHSEFFTVNDDLCKAVEATREKGGRVIAVGTTALRSLESAAENGRLQPCCRETDIFIYPGYSFKICDGLITNFHLPESTLLMLVAAFIGYDAMKELYRIAIAEAYRFFSYGDVSLLLRAPC